MSFGFLGSFRQTQWRIFRQFILNERRVVDARLSYINAELERMGEITVFYERTGGVVESVEGRLEKTTQVTERRTGFHVTEGSSLFKLIQAYIAQGGNPGDISLFLKPDRVLWESDLDPDENPNIDTSTFINNEVVEGALNEQPGFGVVAPESDNRGVGGPDRGGWLKWGRFPFRRVGRNISLSEADQQIAYHLDFSRRWANPTINERRNNLEARILKLMDRRDQLLNEREYILAQAVGGSVESVPLADPRFANPNLHVTRIVEKIDTILYNKVARGRSQDERFAQQVNEVVERPKAGASASAVVAQLEAAFQQQESGAAAQEMSGRPDDELIPDFNSVNLKNTSEFDTLWIDEATDDRYSAL